MDKWLYISFFLLLPFAVKAADGSFGQCTNSLPYDDSCFLSISDQNLDEYQLISLDGSLSAGASRLNVLNIRPEFIHTKQYLKPKKLLLVGGGFERSREQLICHDLRNKGFDVAVAMEGVSGLKLSGQEHLQTVKDYTIISPMKLVNELVQGEPVVIFMDVPVPRTLETLPFIFTEGRSEGDLFWQELADRQRLYSKGGLQPIILIDRYSGYSQALYHQLLQAGLHNIYLLDGTGDDVAEQFKKNDLTGLSRHFDLSKKRCL
ncbi:hypothetical protein [Kistimonas asteriae]|uniref:hypothetical protein n=1 Tax=Kistimonas asteriae TaxID=517724 RepID=UPI001BA4A589|nr:hypothetical protein [Kistimonas asteriae]